MNESASLSRTERVGVGLSFIVFPLVWVFAFAVHPGLSHPRLLLGPVELIQRAHGNALLQFAHALVTVNAALTVVVMLHYRRLLRETPAAWYGLIGAISAVLGAVTLAADKGALCLTISALDTLPQQQFGQAMPGLIAIFSFKGWMAITLGLVLMPIGVLIQAVGMATVHALPRRQLVLLFVGVAAIAFPDARGYDHDTHRDRVRALGVTPVIARRRTANGSGRGTRRWFVERSFAWLRGFKRLRTVTNAAPTSTKRSFPCLRSDLCPTVPSEVISQGFWNWNWTRLEPSKGTTIVESLGDQ